MHAGPKAKAAPIGIALAMSNPSAVSDIASAMMMATKIQKLYCVLRSPTIQYTSAQKINLGINLGSSVTYLDM